MAGRKPKSDGAALLAAVCAHPDDDTPRLVYADWLEEQGKPERAELIRVQCELAQIEGDDPRRPDLEMRAGSLLLAHGLAWVKEVPAWARKHVDFRRGFEDGVRVGLRTFLKNGAGLVRQSPITTLHVTNIDGALDQLAECPYLAAVRDLH